MDLRRHLLLAIKGSCSHPSSLSPPHPLHNPVQKSLSRAQRCTQSVRGLGADDYVGTSYPSSSSSSLSQHQLLFDDATSSYSFSTTSQKFYPPRSLSSSSSFQPTPSHKNPAVLGLSIIPDQFSSFFCGLSSCLSTSSSVSPI